MRHVACMTHRGLAQSLSGVTELQRAGLALGSVKGTNHRAGYSHRPESKAKASASHKALHAANPAFAKQRGEKVRGAAHYRWKGGASKLNKSIRQMTESRRWMDAIKARDGCCTRCGATALLEAHHLATLAALIERLEITSRDDARAKAAVLWDLSNGVTLCQGCHYDEHGRNRHAD